MGAFELANAASLEISRMVASRSLQLVQLTKVYAETSTLSELTGSERSKIRPIELSSVVSK